MDSGEETGHMEHGAGSKVGIGKIDNDELRHRDKGICFLAMARTAVEGMSMAEWRGRDNTEDKSTDEGEGNIDIILM
jgi:hypothetical protein